MNYRDMTNEELLEAGAEVIRLADGEDDPIQLGHQTSELLAINEEMRRRAIAYARNETYH